jgi:ABC-type nitrate/sulfonate/bicarbonate transport system permease component
MTDASMTVAATPPAKAPAAKFLSGAFVPRLIAGVTILALWEGVVRAFAPAYVAKPSGIVMAIPKVIVDPAFLNASFVTLSAVAQGLAIALVFGTMIGLLIGRSVVADRTLRHYVNGFYAVPMVVVLPLFSLWFGYSGATRLATIVFSSLFSIIVNVADGARAVPREYVEVSRSFRAGRISTLLEVVLPASMPYFLAGLRLAAGRALIGAVVAEFFTAIGGLGYFILYNSRTFHHNEAFVGVLLLAGFGVGFDMLVNGSIRRFMPWYRRDEAAS